MREILMEYNDLIIKGYTPIQARLALEKKYHKRTIQRYLPEEAKFKKSNIMLYQVGKTMNKPEITVELKHEHITTIKQIFLEYGKKVPRIGVTLVGDTVTGVSEL